MQKWWLLYHILYLCGRSSSEKTFLDSPFNLQLLRNLRNWTFDAFGKTGTEERYLQIARNANTVQKIIPDDVPFFCNVTGGRSLTMPDSIHKLRPGDIDVIAAMGDSLSAGAGIFARELLQVIIENRGVTAIGGGQGTWRQYLTIPNILKEFNPNLIGYALGDSLASHEAAQLNVAESGSRSEDMPYMATIVVKRIKRDRRINLQKHWKLIMLFIGDNDFCSDMCWVSSPWSILEKHKGDMLQVLRTLRDNLPRTFVSIIPPLHLKYFFESGVTNSSFQCILTSNFICPCIFGVAYQSYRHIYYDVMKRWQELDMEIAAYPEFQTDDFAVVGQPIFLESIFPFLSDGHFDRTYFSEDCIHLTQKSNALFANGIWNNLLESVGAKQRKLDDLFETFRCPTPDKPYLATILNSKI